MHILTLVSAMINHLTLDNGMRIAQSCMMANISLEEEK